MRIVETLPRSVREIENVWIPLTDGTRLAARIWLPEDAEAHPVPAVLEYLPYRKRDATAPRDALTHPWFAGHGYAAIRVDMRGNGDSEGLMFDEYLKQEQDDALEVLAWIAAQPWCSGRIGMMGISWGGFNGLQVAARRPPELAAVVSLASTVDRFGCDIHYKGGCLLNVNLGWSSTMLAYSSRPPDPAIVGPGWRAMWLERLAEEPHLAATWLAHQRRDSYWKHGSIAEDYAAVQVPVLAICGLADGYRETVIDLLENLRHVPVKGILGPWVHKYPHFAIPAPRIGFLQEALRWWDRWLKDEPTGVEDDPDLRIFCHEGGHPPRPYREERAGSWLAEPAWPSPHITRRTLHLGSGSLDTEAGETVALVSRAPEDVGEAAGEFCTYRLGPDLPGDQRLDDARSLAFDGPPLEADMILLGRPLVRLTLAVDRPQAHIACRLNAVNADGRVERVTYGVLNLSHREGSETPKPMPVGETVTVELALDVCGHRLKPGQRLRLAVSTACWPLLWPDPEPVTLTVVAGRSSLALPIRREAGQPEPVFAEPETAPPLATETLRPERHERRFCRDHARGLSTAEIVDDAGEERDLATGLVRGQIAREYYSIDPDDPSSARMATHWTMTLARGAWSIRTESFASMTADATHFHLEAQLEAYEGDEQVHHKTFARSIPRDHL